MTFHSALGKFAAVTWAIAVVASGAGCGAQSPQRPSAERPTASNQAPAEVTSLIDPRWMSFEKSQPWNWTEIERRITPVMQQFGFRPVGENRGPRFCQGCGDNAPTAEVTVYAPGEFVPGDAPAGQPVDVGGRGGYFRAADWDRAQDRDRDHDAMLTWQYADNAWATVRGTTTMTAGVDRLLELARAVRPDQRTAVTFPLRLADVPARMPLASVLTSVEPIHEGADYGTSLSFAPCFPRDPLAKSGGCHDRREQTGSLTVKVLHRDAYPDRRIGNEVSRSIGGKGGRYDASVFWAAVLVEKDVYVQFDMHPPRGSESTAELEGVLDSVSWAPEPGNEAAWPPVRDWVR